MNCTQFKEQAPAFALGALEPHEHAACERHLADQSVHDGCHEALHAARVATTVLALDLEPVEPSPQSWEGIAARIAGVAPIGKAPRSSSTTVPWLIAAAAILVCLWLVRDREQLVAERTTASDRVTALTSRADTAEQLRARCATALETLQSDLGPRREALSLLQRSGTRVVALGPQPGVTSTANLIWHPSTQRAFVLGTGLAAPAGKDYELWVIRGDKKIPAGLLHADASGALVATVDASLLGGAAPDALAVTLEAAGGKPQPEGPIVLVGKI